MNSLRIHPSKKLNNATVEIPGSKSYTNRALLLAAMTPERVTLSKPLDSDDTRAMISCLKSLGVEIIESDTGLIEVVGSINNVKDGEYELNADLSGTTIRFMVALAAIVPGQKVLTGGEGLQKRPISDLVDALRQLGAQIEYLDKEGCPPLRVSSGKLKGGTVKLKGDTSSQYLSALLMIAPVVGEVSIEIIGELISKPYVNMTVDTMTKFGANVVNEGYKTFIISPGQTYDITEYEIEGDVSSASYFFAVAALNKITITVKNINPNSKQADMGFLRILEEMGSNVKYDQNSITITGAGVKPIQVDMESCPDQAPTLAVIAAFADGITTITGVQSLRVKETERVAAVEAELKKMGINSSSTIDTLVIYGGNPKPASISTYGDHRMAMAFAVAGTKLEGFEIKDPSVVTKTFPEFWDKLTEIGVGLEETKRNLILIGMRGSGKSTVGKLLASKLDLEFVDIDKKICEKNNLTVSEIINKKGWDYFRNEEAAVTKSVSESSNSVISTGGGVVLRPENIESLKQGGNIIYLRAAINTLTERLAENSDRPPLTDQKAAKGEIKHILEERAELYETAADTIIDTDNLTPEYIVDMILALVKDGTF